MWPRAHAAVADSSPAFRLTAPASSAPRPPPQREYEINFDEKATITPTHDDAAIASINFALVPIGDLPNREAKINIDIMGMLRSVGEPQDLQSKKGQSLTKRDMSIADDSGHAVNLTMWGEVRRRAARARAQPPAYDAAARSPTLHAPARPTHRTQSARNLQAGIGSIVAVKNAQLSEWDGRSVRRAAGTARPRRRPRPGPHRALPAPHFSPRARRSRRAFRPSCRSTRTTRRRGASAHISRRTRTGP